MLKEYYVINGTTNIVEQTVLVEEAETATFYPGKIMVEVNPQLGVPRSCPGQLFYCGKFWSQMQNTPSSKIISQFEFRNLFTFEEKVKVDNFSTDSSVSESSKKILNSILKSLDSASFVDLELDQVIDGLNFLMTVGYLTAARVAQILAKEKPV